MSNKNNLSVREIQKEDITSIINYCLNSGSDFLKSMGVDLSKMPAKEQWKQMLNEQLNQSYEEKKSYCIIWLLNDEPVGHSNINRIVFGEEAYMHLHIWKPGNRTKGMGVQFVKMTLSFFFENMQLKKICCEPYALNPAPNKTMEKTGFEFVKEYITVPGFINFEQPVKHWELTCEKFKSLINFKK